MLNINKKTEKIDNAVLIGIEKEYFVFESDNGCRTTFLKMDKIINKDNSLKIGKKYSLEHINGKAKVVSI